MGQCVGQLAHGLDLEREARLVEQLAGQEGVAGVVLDQEDPYRAHQDRGPQLRGSTRMRLHLLLPTMDRAAASAKPRKGALG